MEGLVNRWKDAMSGQTKSKGKKPRPATVDPPTEDSASLPSPLQVPPLIKSKAQEIIDILCGKSSDPPSMLKFGKVCEVLLEVAERKAEVGRLDDNREAKGKSNHLAQVVADLEAKYIDSEQEKAGLMREKEMLSGKVEQLQREVNLLMVTYSTLRQDLVATLKRSQNTLEAANKALLGELEEERTQKKELQALWEIEVEHFRETLEQLQPTE